jgi:hypothetical protein
MDQYLRLEPKWEALCDLLHILNRFSGENSEHDFHLHPAASQRVCKKQKLIALQTGGSPECLDFLGVQKKNVPVRVRFKLDAFINRRIRAF